MRINEVSEIYKVTAKMTVHIIMHGSDWYKYELSQWECMQLNFLSGNGQDEYYCYNTTVQRCGDVIKFSQNTTLDSSRNMRYSWIPK